MSNNLNLPQVAAAQNQKEVTINQTTGLVDAAVTENLAVDLAAGNVTLTSTQFRQAVTFTCAGHTVARALAVPAIKRLFVVVNNGTADVTVTLGSSTVVVAPDSAGLVYNNGTTIKGIASGGSGGAASFVELADTFASYTGRGLQLLRVNSGESGVESVALGTVAIPAGEKGANNGVATLDADGKIPATQLPSLAINDVFSVSSQAAMLALDAQRGDVAVRTDISKSFILSAEPASTLANWVELLAADGVQSVGLSMPASEFDVTNSPVTTTGVLTAAWKAQGPNLVFAGPLSGASAAPTFRGLVADDLPAATSTARGALTEPSVSSTNIYARRNLGVADWVALGSAALAQQEGFPFVNLIIDSGRFAQCAPGQLSIPTTTPFSVDNDYFSSYNGGTFNTVGKFIHNNSTNGGAGGNLTQPVIDLLNAMGRTGSNARYGAEFNVLEIAQGAGTGAAGPVDPTDGASYLMYTQSSPVTSNFSNRLTFVGWIRVTAGTVFLNNQSVPLNRAWINGVEQPEGWVALKPDMGWVHLRTEAENLLGYITSKPGFYGTSGALLQMAIPAYFNGVANPGIHVAPLRGFDAAIIRQTTSASTGQVSWRTGPTYFNGPLSLPGGSPTNNSINFGGATTGLYGTTAAVNIAAAGAVRMNVTSATGVSLATNPLGFGAAFGTPDVVLSRQVANTLNVAATGGMAITGPINVPGGLSTAPSINFGGAQTGLFGSSVQVFIGTSGVSRVCMNGATDFRLQAAVKLGWGAAFGAAADVQLSRSAANTLSVEATSGATFSGPVGLPSYTVATVPAVASYAGSMIYVSDAAGGASPAYSNGSNWISLLTGANI